MLAAVCLVVAGPGASAARSGEGWWSTGRRVWVDLAVLAGHYGQVITGVQFDRQGRIWVHIKKHGRLIYDDRRPKTPALRLADPDLQDTLAQIYPLGRLKHFPSRWFDPGRIRVEVFFKAVYGRTAAEVRANLVRVPFCGRRVWFNARAGAAQALARVGRELAALLRREPRLKKYVLPMGGTFYWRKIAGTGRLSPHAWGMAIDLNTRYGGYWRWGGTRTGRTGPYPQQIVRIFERHGFIWGGKWGHFDLPHFEYRPELLTLARILSTDDGPAPR
jgi:hypothetical protein